jgi:putative flippase GtrA
MQLFVKRSVTRQQIIQFLEYMVGGTAYFWSGYLVFAFCYSGMHWNWLPSKMAADIIGWTLNYFIQRYWAFSNKKLQHHEGRILGRYGLLTACNFVLDYLIIASLNAIGISPYLGFFISAGFFTVWNYIWYRFWVFLAKDKMEG